MRSTDATSAPESRRSAQEPVLHRLRAATAGIHQALDRSVLVARPGAEADDWRRFLAATLGWVEPLEERLRQGLADAGPELLPEAGERLVKAAWLRHDLADLGLGREEVAALPRCSGFGPLAGAGEVLGAAYVVEGATLGGRFLAGLAADALPGARLRHLRGYGDDTGRRWRELRSALESLAGRGPAAVDAAATTARRAFGTVHGWMDERGCLAPSR